MKTYIVNGQKVYDYSAARDPASAIRSNIPSAALDPAVGESTTVTWPLPATCPPPPAPPEVGTPEWLRQEVEARRAAEAEVRKTPEQIQAEHKARYSWDSLNAAIVELTRAKAETHDIAQQLLYEHEGPYYHYCATGHSGRDYTEYQDGTEWAERRAYLTKLVNDTERDRPPVAKKQKRPTLVKRLRLWWSNTNE